MSDFEPRRAKPGDQFTITGANGEQHEFAADDEGIVRPSNQDEAGLLDSLGLPVARKAMADDQAAAPKGGK